MKSTLYFLLDLTSCFPYVSLRPNFLPRRQAAVRVPKSHTCAVTKGRQNVAFHTL
jgi:hypothetical protein